MNYDRWRDGQVLIRETLRRRGAIEAPGDPREPAPLVSVIVVCWNAAEVLGRCLERLFAQDYPSYEVIVVDDGSDDTTEQVARQAAHKGELKLVLGHRNRGCPSARNLGLRHAAGGIVAFIDADGFADPRWLSEIVKAFGDDTSVGGVASTVFFDDNPLVVNGAGGTVNRQGWAADLSMNESYEVAELSSEALYPMGCGMALRREAIERVGPFDDRMLNYYDDVDYGTRLWRAGYRLKVAQNAWIDHGFGAAARDSAHKRLLCERHRMRVVLKHASMRTLSRWTVWEARGLRSAPAPVRTQKLRAIAWNLRHLPSTLLSRRRLSGADRAPARLLDCSWGDGFPVGLPERLTPAPEMADASVIVGDDDDGQLLHGWFAQEASAGRSYRWAGLHAATLLRLDAPGALLHLDYAHVPTDIGGVDVAIRRLGPPAGPQQVVWRKRLVWQYIARSVENYPLTLPEGDYEVLFSCARGWSDPPRETRKLSLALSELSVTGAIDFGFGGLDMGSERVEHQLVAGWFEAEQEGELRYRWASGQAAAMVRLGAPAVAALLEYRLPPMSTSELELELSPLDGLTGSLRTKLRCSGTEWQNRRVSLDIPPGDYRVTLHTDSTWSNPDGADRRLWPENRALGFALSSLTFIGP